MPMQSQHCSSPQIRSGRHFLNSSNVFKVLHKWLFQAYTSLQQPRYMCTLLWSHTRVNLHVNGSVRAKSGGRCSRSAGSRSPRRLFCTNSFVHGISVIKTRRSLTTEIVKSSFHCKDERRLQVMLSIVLIVSTCNCERS